MDDLFIEDEIKDLRKKIAYYNTLYYKKAISEISDSKYDQLIKRLQSIEKKYPQYKIDNSPTAIVGSDISGNNKIITHKVRMYSLENAYSLEEIEQFINRIKKVDDSAISFTTELKIDGFSINLYYENGKLQYATTRGNGFEGEDVTRNVKTIKYIPNRINYKEPIEIRGEIYLPINEFDRINRIREINGEKLFANPRNAAAGTIKLKDVNLVASRKLNSVFYSVGLFNDSNIKSQKKLLDFLRMQGFNTVKIGFVTGMEEITDQCENWEQSRYDLDTRPCCHC